MEEVKKSVAKHIDGHKMVMTFIFIAATAVIFLGIGYVAGTNSGGSKDVNVATITPIATVEDTAAVATTATTTGTADATAGWKTYTNDTHEFSVKYPSDWTQKDNENYPKDGGFLYAPGLDNSNYYIVFTTGIAGHGAEGLEKVSSNQKSVGDVACAISKWNGTNTTTFGDMSNNRLISAECSKGDQKVTFEADFKADQETLFASTFDKILSTFQFTK